MLINLHLRIHKKKGMKNLMNGFRNNLKLPDSISLNK